MAGMKTTFAKHLSRLREQKDMTRYRLAQLSGISKEGISKLEEADSDPKLSTLVKLARALGVKTWELLPDWTAPAGEQPKSTRVDHAGDEAAKLADRKLSGKTTWTAEELEACPYRPVWITDTGMEAMLFVHACEKLLRGPESNQANARLLENLAKIETILRREPVLPIADKALKLVAELVQILRRQGIYANPAIPAGNVPLANVQRLRQLLYMPLEDMEDLMKEYMEDLDGDEEAGSSKKGRRRGRRR
jgi:transcriptional regulator with XRE-family HTH domain